MDNKQYVGKAKDTVSDLMAQFMETYASRQCSLRTRSGYQGQINRYLEPTIGYIRYQDLTSSAIEKIYADMSARGLSNQTIKHLHRLLREALTWAFRKKLLKENPTDSVDIPQVEKPELEM